MTNSTIKTWRERIGAGPDFPVHAPTDVERAMEAEIAELRAQAGMASMLEIQKRAEEQRLLDNCPEAQLFCATPACCLYQRQGGAS